MNIFRIIWGVVVAGIVVLHFWKSWDAEHNKKEANNTSVLNGIASLIWLLPVIFVIMLWAYEPEVAIINFATYVMNIMVLFSVCFVIILAIMPLIRKKISARACAIMWIAPVYVFYNVFALSIGLQIPAINIYIPKRVLFILLSIWLVGFIGILAFYVVSDFIFKRNIKRNSEEIKDEHILEIWKTVRDDMNFPMEVKLLAAKNAKGPFSMGRTKKTFATVLPYECLEGKYTDKQLAMIFSHELHHLQRNDVDTKVFMANIRAFCWFNPFVWIAAYKSSKDIELSCDEIVVYDMNDDDRKEYAAMLLTETASINGFTTCLSAAGSTLRYRMKNVVSKRKVFKGTVAVAVLVFVCMLCYGIVGFTFEKGNCAEMIFAQGIQADVFFRDSDEEYAYIADADKEGLIAYFDSVTVERISGGYEYVCDEGKCTLAFFNENEYIDVYDNAIVVRNTSDGVFTKNRQETYKTSEPIDWEKIRQCVKK